MKRVIVDYKKLTQNILDLLVEKYPDGYNDEDIISFKNAAGQSIEAVEVMTEDTAYLVKVSVKLEQEMERFSDDEDEDFDSSDADSKDDFETSEIDNDDDEDHEE